MTQEFRGFAGGSDPVFLRRLRSSYHLRLSSRDVMRLEDMLLRSLSDMAGRWRPRLLTTWTSVCWDVLMTWQAALPRVSDPRASKQEGSHEVFYDLVSELTKHRFCQVPWSRGQPWNDTEAATRKQECRRQGSMGAWRQASTQPDEFRSWTPEHCPRPLWQHLGMFLPLFLWSSFVV